MSGNGKIGSEGGGQNCGRDVPIGPLAELPERRTTAVLLLPNSRTATEGWAILGAKRGWAPAANSRLAGSLRSQRLLRTPPGPMISAYQCAPTLTVL